VREEGADVGLANDGDADRLLAVDENGEPLDGDQIMLICALDLMKAGKLKDNVLVTTVMSNVGLAKAMKEHGGRTVKTSVGDRYVLEEMLKHDYKLGGEQSGPIHRPFGRSPFPSREGQKNCVPRDGDDEKESPSPVEKGERTRLRVGG
jgi:phosphomannomutase